MGSTFGKYRLLHRLGRGGSSEVWIARTEGAGSDPGPLLVKRILPHLHGRADLARHLVEEARISHVLDHPNIARVYEVGRVEGRWFVATEWVRGETLGRVVRRAGRGGGSLPAAAAARIVSDAARALHHAHTRTDEQGRPLRIVHRDVTPSNLVVGYGGRTKILDFGIASAGPQGGDPLEGQWAYLSPEQCRGRPLDGRADVFSLGVVLWEILTGRRLFKAKTPLLSMRRIVDGDVSAPRSLAPDLPLDLESISLRALAPQPEDRFPTAAAFADALDAFLLATGQETGEAEIARLMDRLFPGAEAAWAELLDAADEEDVLGRAASA